MRAQKLLLVVEVFVLWFSCIQCAVEESEVNQIQSGSLTDVRDGITYKTVKIGNQWWMAENLAYLPDVDGKSEWSTTEPFYYVYDFEGTHVDEALKNYNYTTYGVLYNYPAACESCPEGWHLPSTSEWISLFEYISNENGYTRNSAFNGWENVGKHLKSKVGWKNNGNGLDSYEFCALPAGYYENGIRDFDNIGAFCYWWSTTSPNSEWTLSKDYVQLKFFDSDIIFLFSTVNSALSVRCIKD